MIRLLALHEILETLTHQQLSRFSPGSDRDGPGY